MRKHVVPTRGKAGEEICCCDDQWIANSRFFVATLLRMTIWLVAADPALAAIGLAIGLPACIQPSCRGYVRHRTDEYPPTLLFSIP
jgi:hypothetical protein